MYAESLFIEVDKMPTVTKDRQTAVQRPPSFDLMETLRGFLPPSDPMAALAYWGSVGSIIGAVVAVFQIYEMVSGKRLSKGIQEISETLGIEEPKKKKKSKNPLANLLS